MAVVHILRSDSAKNAIVMHLLHCLFFILSLHLSHPPASTRDPQHSGRCTISGRFLSRAPNMAPTQTHPPTTATTGLDRPPMADPVHFCLTKGLACSTQHAYSRQFLLFCSQSSRDPIPASEDTSQRRWQNEASNFNP